jgi:hypothetical protein
MERFNLNKLNKAEGKEQYQVKITKRFIALENSDNDADNNQSSGYEVLKRHAVLCIAVDMASLHVMHVSKYTVVDIITVGHANCLLDLLVTSSVIGAD